MAFPKIRKRVGNLNLKFGFTGGAISSLLGYFQIKFERQQNTVEKMPPTVQC